MTAFFKQTVIAFFFIIAVSDLRAYVVSTEYYGYFHFEDKTQVYENIYHVPVSISPAKTAFVVMDPWIDMLSEKLNHYFGQITAQWIAPLIDRARNCGHTIIILTNDPKASSVNTRIHPELLAMVDCRNVFLLYHENLSTASFANWLIRKKIDTLIYTGFASNQCVIGRPTGMIMMKPWGFRLFFVPEASGALELENTWENQAIHRATSATISQWIGGILHWKDFIERMKPE